MLTLMIFPALNSSKQIFHTNFHLRKKNIIDAMNSARAINRFSLEDICAQKKWAQKRKGGRAERRTFHENWGKQSGKINVPF